MLLFVAVWPRGKSLYLSKPTYPWLALLMVLSLLTQLCYFAAVSLLPLGVHNVVYQTTIFVTLVILTRFVLEEETGKVRLLTLVVLLVGIVLVLQPEPLFHHDASAGTTSNITLLGDSSMTTLGGNPGEKYTDIYVVTNETLWILLSDSRQGTVSFDVKDPGPIAGAGTITGYILMVGSGVFEAFWILTAGRPLAAVDPVVQTFWMGSVLTPTCLILMVYCETPVWPSGALHFSLILGHSLGSLAHIFGACICSQLHSPLVAAMAMASSVLMSFTMQHTGFVGILPGNGNWIEIVGAIITTIGIAAGPLFDLLVRRRQNDQALWEDGGKGLR